MEFFLQLKTEVAELLRVEEKMWQQRSYVHWMISGDKNSSYFHNRASQQFRRNNITELRDSRGRMASQPIVCYLKSARHWGSSSIY